MPTCPSCSAEYADDLDACSDCGAEPPAIHCPRCSEEFSGSDACPACGWTAAELTCAAHPDRPAVGRCVICGIAVCGECRRGEGRAYLCSDHGDVTVIQGWAQIYTTASEFEAQLLRDNLIAEDVEARIFSQKDNMLSVDLGELSIVRLLVPAWDYDRSMGVIRRHMDAGGEVAFACPACGEAYEPGAESCAACGAELAPTVAD